MVKGGGCICYDQFRESCPECGPKREEEIREEEEVKEKNKRKREESNERKKNERQSRRVKITHKETCEKCGQLCLLCPCTTPKGKQKKKRTYRNKKFIPNKKGKKISPKSYKKKRTKKNRKRGKTGKTRKTGKN